MAADSISNYLSMANYNFLAKVPWIQPAVIGHCQLNQREAEIRCGDQC